MINIYKLLIITLFLIYPLYADENLDSNLTMQEEYMQESNWNYFGEFQTYFTSIHKDKDKAGVDDFNDLMNYNSIQLNVDYFNDNFYFSMTPYAYIYFTESDKELLGSNYSKPFKFQDFFFRSLYMSYTMDKFTIG